MEYKKKQRKEDIDNRGISVAKSKLVLFLVVGIVVLVLSSSGEVFAQETSEPKWELVETVINHENRPTEFIVGVTPGYYSSPRYDGTFNKYTIEETYFLQKNRVMDRGGPIATAKSTLQADVEMRADFTKPPEILVPGEKITLKATVSGTGTSPGRGSLIQFEYRADGINLRDTTHVSTGSGPERPFSTHSISPYFVVPKTHDGEISIVAFLWNAGAVNVRWIYRAQDSTPSKEEEENCEDYCKNQNEHAIWASGDYSSGCVCECEKGWTMEEQGCVSCGDICGKKDHYVYDPDLSYNNVCECKCEDGYEPGYGDLGKKICKKVVCPENSKNVADLTGPSLPSNDRKLNNNCYCDEGYITSYGTCIKKEPGTAVYFIDPGVKEITVGEKIEFTLKKKEFGRYTTISNDEIEWAVTFQKSISLNMPNIEIGTIDTNGEFTGKNIGTSVVTAKIDDTIAKAYVTVKCSEDVEGDINEILRLYKNRIPKGQLWRDFNTLVQNYNDNRYYAHYLDNILDNPPAAGYYNNILSIAGYKIYDQYACGSYQAEVLKFLSDIQSNPEECTLLNNYDFGPIEGRCGRHHAVVIYPKGTDWKTEGTVLDPWPSQSPEYVRTSNWGFFPIAGESQQDYREYPTYPRDPDSLLNAELCNRADDVQLEAVDLTWKFVDTIVGVLQCPVDLQIIDSEGRRFGMLADGSMAYEIPLSFIWNTKEGETENNWFFELNSKTPNQYNLELMGIDDGTFELLWVSSENKEIIYYGEQSIKKGEIVKVSIDPDNPTAPLILPNGSEIQPTILEPITDIAPPGDPSTPPCTGTSTYAYIESRTMENGKEVSIPVMMCNANDLANMDFSVSYDSTVLRFKDAEKGSLNSNSLFESNEISSGNVKLSFASSKGVSGSGSIAILIFNVVGSNGDSSILTGSVNTASTSSGSPIGLTINPGEFTVGGAKTIYVDDDFTDDPANHKWDTIQEGITDANAGDTVLVYNGRYTETVVLNKRLTLIGEGMPEIDAQSLGDAINIKADNCTVKGFNCVNAQLSPYAGIGVDSSNNVIVDNTCKDNYIGIYLLDSSNEIRNNIASSNNKYGIRVQASDGNIISNNTVKENGNTGIYLQESNDNRIADNDVSNNVKYHGISVSSSNNNEVRNNVADSNHVAGITLWNSTDNIISNNTAKENGHAGIYLHESNDNRIADNDVSNNEYGGIIVSSSSNNNEVRNNVANSNQLGIALVSSTDNIISKNTAKENGNIGIHLQNSNDNRIADNDVSNNEYHGISVSSSNNNEVRNNVANSNHYDGINLWNSTDNTIANNTAKNNEHYGISLLWDSNNNRIYMNNFLDNPNNVYSDDSTNIWHSPSERTYRFKGNTHTNYLGNYWDDYTGSDTDNDGIGDRSYNINSDNNDNYPLKEPVENYFLPIRLEVVPILFP